MKLEIGNKKPVTKLPRWLQCDKKIEMLLIKFLAEDITKLEPMVTEAPLAMYLL